MQRIVPRLHTNPRLASTRRMTAPIMRFAISGSSFVTRGSATDHPALHAPLCAHEPDPGDAWGHGHLDDSGAASDTSHSAVRLLASAVRRALAQAGLPREGMRWAVIVSVDIGPASLPSRTGSVGGPPRIDPHNLEAMLNEALRSAVPVLTIHGASGAASAIALAEDLLSAGAFDVVVSAATGTQESNPSHQGPREAPHAELGASALVVESFSKATQRGLLRWMQLPEAHGRWQRCSGVADERDDAPAAPRSAGAPELRRLPVRTRTRPVQSPAHDRRTAGRSARRAQAPREDGWPPGENNERTAGRGIPEVHVTLSSWNIPSLAQHKLLSSALMGAARRGAAEARPVGRTDPSSPEDEAPALLLAGRVLQPLLLELGLPTQLGPDTGCGVIVAANAALTAPDVAAALVRRYRLGPLSLNVASGSAASSDALAVAANAIRSGRAQRVLVLSVELDTPLRCPNLHPAAGAAADLPATGLEGAAAVLLESTDSLDRRGGISLGRIVHCLFLHADSADHRLLIDLVERHADKTFYVGGDSFLRLALTALLDERRARIVDFGTAAQRAHGLTGLLQLVAHCERHGAGADRQGAVILGGGHDRRAVLLVIEPD